MLAALLAQSSSSSECVVGRWGSWSACNKTCGAGYRHRSRKVTHHKYGTVCPHKKQVASCKLRRCTKPPSHHPTPASPVPTIVPSKPVRSDTVCHASAQKIGCNLTALNSCSSCVLNHTNYLLATGCTSQEFEQLCWEKPTPVPTPAPTAVPTYVLAFCNINERDKIRSQIKQSCKHVYRHSKLCVPKCQAALLASPAHRFLQGCGHKWR